MANIFEKIKNAGIDKWIHFVACFAIAALVALIFKGTMELPNANCGFIGWIAGVLAGLAKEIVDFFRGGKFDGGDFIADILGATVAFGFAFLM